MESSYFIGGSEECNSCESGWTTYIASPMHDDDAGTDSGDDNGDAAADDDSDDSMASDASSGPSHREQYYGAGHEMDSSENDDEDDENEEDKDEGDGECSDYSHERSYKRKEKSRGRMDLIQKKPIHLEKKIDPVCTTSKVRKTNSRTKAK